MKNKTIAKKSVRLGVHTTPVHYEITLAPDLVGHTFVGEETITFATNKASKTVTLHAKELTIVSATLLDGSSGVVTYDDKLETATFAFAKSLPKGTHKIHLVFRGVLADNMRGFYKSRYMVDGEERFMAVTQFEATDARRCIPCFDEPTHKAVFQIHLVVPTGKTAISNTLPVSIKEHTAGYNVVSFAPTPKMSTYLLAFIVGDFEWLEQKTKSGVLVRVMTVPGKKHQGAFALDTTVRSLEFYEAYFGIKYPLNTLDMLAIPDFASLAMENWGAITFREIGLLVDESQSSTSSKELIAIVIAHELAHQWFGNLVTMEWWTHLWLNEGFASYIPYLAIDALFPDWNIWSQFATDDLAIALKLDALRHTHPIEVDVHDPNEIGEIFDAVSYSKGATVIRMLAEYIGDKAFRAGLAQYLKKHSYKNASTVHLWEAFEKASKKPVKKMMAIWTGKSGYPLVSAEIAGTKLKLTQSRFYSSETSRKQSTDTTLWPIPLSIVTDKGEKRLELMTKKSFTMPVPKNEWFKFNAHEGSLYRVRYDARLLVMLKGALMEDELAEADRLGLIRDCFALTEAGQMSTVDALEMAALYRYEREYTVWIEILAGLRFVSNLLVDTPAHKQFALYARDLLSDIVAHVGWDTHKGESHNTTLLRPLILGAAALYGDTHVIKEAQRRFAERATSAIPADLRGVVYATVVRAGGEKEYAEILEIYRTETLSEEKNRLLAALGQSTNKKLLTRTLVFILGGEVRMQDYNGAFASVLVNPHGRTLGLDFIMKNWKKIGVAYGDGNHLLSRLISVWNRNTTREAYTKIKTFFKTHTAPAAERTIDQTLEHIDSNVRWIARDGKKIAQWLAAYK